MNRTLILGLTLGACADGGSVHGAGGSAVATPGSARAAGLELAVTAAGSTIHVTLRNRGEGPLRIYGYADSGEVRHHDFLRVELTGPDGGHRTLLLSGSRNTSTNPLFDLAPGQAIDDVVDLAGWAHRDINGATSLASGSHAATVVYDVHQAGVWSGTLTVGPLTIHAP